MLLTLLLLATIILGIVAIVMAVTRRYWQGFAIGAAIAFVIYIALLYVH